MQSLPGPILKSENYDELANQQWTLIELSKIDFDLNLQDLLDFAKHNWKIGSFKPAAVGRGAEQSRQDSIRSDSIYWLTGENLIEKKANLFLQQIQNELNQNLYCGLQSFEAHLAHYAEGQFYQEHIDQPRAQSFLHGERLITFVLYLNKNWKAGDGGELKIRNTAPELPEFQAIQPTFGTLILFKSQSVSHQVLLSNRERWSLTGWFRRS